MLLLTVDGCAEVLIRLVRLSRCFWLVPAALATHDLNGTPESNGSNARSQAS